MNAAFSLWEERIAPVFDVSTQVVIVVNNTDGMNMERVSLRDGPPATRVAHLLERKVATLVCGAISRPLANAVTAHGITLHSFVMGGLEDVIAAWRSERLDNEGFRMPGCRRRQGRSYGDEDASTDLRGWGHMSRARRRRGNRPDATPGKCGAPRQLAVCRCPQCGLTIPHVPGVPCSGQTCPNCHAPMVRA